MGLDFSENIMKSSLFDPCGGGGRFKACINNSGG